MTKILVVEDDNNLREIYSDALGAEGYEIITAADGEAALATAVKEKPDLIVLDVMMPKISGFDVLDILRSTPETKNAKIMMMTALSQQSDKERGERLGADLYLVKSQVTIPDIVTNVKDLLASAAAPAQPAGDGDDDQTQTDITLPDLPVGNFDDDNATSTDSPTIPSPPTPKPEPVASIPPTDATPATQPPLVPTLPGVEASSEPSDAPEDHLPSYTIQPGDTLQPAAPPAVTNQANAPLADDLTPTPLEPPESPSTEAPPSVDTADEKDPPPLAEPPAPAVVESTPQLDEPLIPGPATEKIDPEQPDLGDVTIPEPAIPTVITPSAPEPPTEVPDESEAWDRAQAVADSSAAQVEEVKKQLAEFEPDSTPTSIEVIVPTEATPETTESIPPAAEPVPTEETATVPGQAPGQPAEPPAPVPGPTTSTVDTTEAPSLPEPPAESTENSQVAVPSDETAKPTPAPAKPKDPNAPNPNDISL